MNLTPSLQTSAQVRAKVSAAKKCPQLIPDANWESGCVEITLHTGKSHGKGSAPVVFRALQKSPNSWLVREAAGMFEAV